MNQDLTYSFADRSVASPSHRGHVHRATGPRRIAGWSHTLQAPHGAEPDC